MDMDAGNLLEKLSDNLSVRRAFGAAYERDGTLIIPVALVVGGGGGGTARTGHGDPAALPGSVPEGDATAHDPAWHDPGRGDAGGGFGGLILPSGVYVVKGDQVRWVPAVDATIVVLASLSLARLLAGVWTRRQKRHGRP
ncbi:MAG TPA: spore germination protein GerW family protein [Streptosporangiaceae bacterium]|nr:spore germination protein GerW family protein [Streptosporangiaceae bacterium]